MLPCFIVKTLFFATEFTCRPRQNFSMGHNLWNFGYGFTREPDGTETWEAVFLFQGRTWKHKMEVFLEGQPLFQLLLLALKKNQMRWVSGSGLQMLPCWIMALQRRNPSRTLCIRLSLKGFSSRTANIILLPCFRISVSLYFLYVPCQQIYH